MTEEQLKAPVVSYYLHPTTLEYLKLQLDRRLSIFLENLSRSSRYTPKLSQDVPENYTIYKYTKPEVDPVATELYRQMIRDYNKQASDLNAKIDNKENRKQLRRKALYEKLKLEFEK